MPEPTPLSPADRLKLEARRDRLMKLLREGGEDLDADDRADLEREWAKLDDQLNRSR